jgi:sarcosine oxidase, subunit delta
MAPLRWLIEGSPVLLIPCPWCGLRDETEFHCGGEAHIVRPQDPNLLDDRAWAAYLFLRSNTKGLHCERWVHRHGCRRWFNVVRHTVTHEIVSAYKMGERFAPTTEAAAR